MSAVARDVMTDAGHIGSIGAQLDTFLRSECGPGSRVADLRPMEDGHAGLTFGFDVINNASESLCSYVLKLAPAGVARRGNTDVYRQAPLLRGLADRILGVTFSPDGRRLACAGEHHGAPAELTGRA